jgi:hypothetical protein
MLKRVQLMLDEDIVQAVALEAHRRKVSRSEVVRQILREKLLPGLPPLEEDPLWGLVGLAKGGRPDDSASIDDVLYGPFEADR